jgi:hypothetical protein
MPHFVNSSILLPYSGFQFLFFLGQVPNKPLDFANLVFKPAGFFTFSFIGAVTRRSLNRFVPSEEVFACLGLAAPSQPPQTRYPSRQRAPPKRLDL